jgi:C4-type Zn-finger protein
MTCPNCTNRMLLLRTTRDDVYEDTQLIDHWSCSKCGLEENAIYRIETTRTVKAGRKQ